MESSFIISRMSCFNEKLVTFNTLNRKQALFWKSRQFWLMWTVAKKKNLKVCSIHQRLKSVLIHSFIQECVKECSWAFEITECSTMLNSVIDIYPYTFRYYSFAHTKSHLNWTKHKKIIKKSEFKNFMVKNLLSWMSFPEDLSFIWILYIWIYFPC